MRLMKDKILVRFTQESIENMYLGKEIVRKDGSKVRLFLSVPYSDDEDRKAAQTVQTAIVEAVGPEVNTVMVGDTAIVNYDLINSPANIFHKDDNGILAWLNPHTTYTKETKIAYANRKSHRDQIVEQANDIDECSLLLGIIRDDKLLPNNPYVFFEHTDPDVYRETPSGIVFKDQRKYFERRILAASGKTLENYGLKEGDKVLTYETDIFEVRLFDKSVDCCFDQDIACLIK